MQIMWMGMILRKMVAALSGGTSKRGEKIGAGEAYKPLAEGIKTASKKADIKIC